jgi:hypothetical protein
VAIRFRVALSTNLDLAGPSNKIVTTGSVGLYTAKLAGFDLGSKLSAVSSFIGVRTGSDLDIEKLTTNLRMAPDGLKADNFNALMPTVGTLVGSGTIDSKNNLDFKMAASLKNAVGEAASTGRKHGNRGRREGHWRPSRDRDQRSGCRTSDGPRWLQRRNGDYPVLDPRDNF